MIYFHSLFIAKIFIKQVSFSLDKIVIDLTRSEGKDSKS